jgi:hypothetical protein
LTFTSKYSTEQIGQIVSLYQSGQSARRIAKQFDSTTGGITNLLKRNGVELRLYRSVLDDDKDAVIARYRGGESLEKIGESYGLKFEAVGGRLRQWGIAIRPRGERKYPVNDNAFSLPTAQALYFAGMIATDGNITIPPHGQARISLTSKDVDILEKFRDFVGAVGRPFYIKNNNNNLVFEIRSKQMADDLLALYGITPRKSKTLRLPDNSPALLSHDWWRGCVEGDGWVRTDKTGLAVIGLCSASLSFVEQYKSFLIHSGVYRGQKISKKATYDLYSLSITGKAASVLARILYADAQTYLSRKQASAARIIYNTEEKEVMPL